MRLQYYGLCCPFFETDEEHDRPIAWYRKKRAEEVVVDDDIASKLRVASSEKEQVIKELNAKIRELDNLKAEDETHAAIIDEKTAEANREIKSLRAELDLSKQAYDLAIAEVQSVTTEKEGLSLQLQLTNTELLSLQKQLKEAKFNQVQESDRAKDQLKTLSELVEVMSDDLERAREDLKDSQAHVQRLTDANVEAKDELRQLKEEAEKHRVEIKTLNEARKCFDLRKEDKRPKKRRLDETTGDSLGSIQSNDGSETIIEAGRIGNDSRQDGSGKGVLNSKMLALPSLVDEEGTGIRVVDEANTPQRDKSVDDTLETSEKECDSLRADIARSRRERDSLRKMVDTLLPLADGNDMVHLKSLEKEVADLKAKLSQAEDACIKVEVEKCEILACITFERDALAFQVKEMNTVILSYHLDNTPDTAMKDEEESAATDSTGYTLPEILLFLKKKLKTQVQQTYMAVWQLQHKLDAQVKENEKLSNKLAALRGKIDLEVNSSTSIEMAPTHDMTEAPSSSYDEGSLCETYTNSINPDFEAGSHDDRKRDPIKREPVANSQLSNKHVSEGNDQQLSEVTKHPPADLEAEFKERIEELESVLLDVFPHRMEGSVNDETISSGKSKEPRSESGQDATNMITAYISLQNKSKHFTKELVDSNKAFGEIITSYASDIAKVKTKLSAKELENEILKSDLEKARNDLANLAVKMEDGKSHADTVKAHMEELNAYRESVGVLERRLEEKEAVKTKLIMEVDQLKADVTVVTSRFEQELKLSCEASDKALQQKRKERDDALAALSDKEKECSELATELEAAEEAISNFEQNGCEYAQQIFEYEKKIHSLRDELGHAESDRQHMESAFDQLKESKEVEVQKLQKKLNSVLVSNKEGMQVYEKLLAKCTSLKADKETALEKNTELTAEVQELQKKLNSAIVLNKESTQLYEKLRADCASLKADKETALEKNAELTANITTLRAENGALVFQKEKQYQSLDLIENQLESVRKEVLAAEDRIKASQKAADQEDRIRSLREEVGWAEKAKQKASIAADATQNDLIKAAKRLDDMLVYTQKLKVEQEERELSLRSNMDSKMLSLTEVIQSLQRQVKSIESEKEDNTTTYERDISLQQDVSLFYLYITELHFSCQTYISII
jgi:chromosome segregation ATPase